MFCRLSVGSYQLVSLLYHQPVRHLVVGHHPQHVVAGEESRAVEGDGVGTGVMDFRRHQADGEPVDGVKAEGDVGLHRHLVGDGQVGGHRVGIEPATKQAGDGHARGLAVRAASVGCFLAFVGLAPKLVLDGLVLRVVGEVVMVLRGVEEGRTEVDGAVGGVVAADGLEDRVAVAARVPPAGFQHTLRALAEGVPAVVGDALQGAHPQHLRERVARGEHHPPAGVGPGGDDPLGGDGVGLGIQPPRPVGVGGDGAVPEREHGLDVGLHVIQPGERVLVAEKQQGVPLEAEEILRVVFGGHHQLARGEPGFGVGPRAEDVEAVAEELRVGIGDGVVFVDGLQLAEVPQDILAGGAGILVIHLVLD